MNPKITNDNSGKIVEATRELLKAFGYYVDNLWHVDDVHFICEQQALPSISNEEAMEIFAIAAGQSDGENGFSWPQLEHALRTFLHRKAAVSKLYAEENNPA